MASIQCHPAFRGFTILEALIASFIVAIATIGVGSMLAASSHQSEATSDASVSQALARQLMEEIAAKPINDQYGKISLGPESGESTRSLFDQIDDYHGYTDSTSAIQMLDGTSIDLGTGMSYTRSVSVQYRETPSGAASMSDEAPFCVVTVTVTASDGKPIKLVRLFARTNKG
jgi:MSHA pilin protein MshD